MNKAGNWLSVLTTTVVLSGCAVGQRYDYANASVGLPVSGTTSLGVGVVDRRAYVLDGDKKPTFVGIQRGGYGNPFDVHTASDTPLASELATALANSLTSRGFGVSRIDIALADDRTIEQMVVSEGEMLNVVLVVNEWKTDSGRKFKLSYDLIVRIVDQSGATVAQASDRSLEEEIGGGGVFEGQASRTAAQSFDLKLGRIFNSPEIRAALDTI